jgi:ribonuclease HI
MYLPTSLLQLTHHFPQHQGHLDPRTNNQQFHGCVHSSAAHSHGPGHKGNIHHAAGSSKKNPDEITAADRRFHPESEYPPHFTLQEIQVNIGPWVCLACPSASSKCSDCKQFEGHEDTLVIAIHGECVTEGNAMRSAIGLWYGHGNRGNISDLISRKDNHTRQIAELSACLRALRHATFIIDKRRSMMRQGKVLRPLNTFVIKTDSEYVVNSLTEWLPKWKSNGWKTCKGAPVANVDMLKLAEAGIVMLEQIIQVKFWLVPKENNKEARFSAQLALTAPY